MTGPLVGLRIVEMVGIGPTPFCAMLLADLGADVVRVDRMDRAPSPVVPDDPRFDVLARSRRSVAVDLKTPDGVADALRLIDRADGVIEGFRPGAMERLGLAPDRCLARNPRLVYGRMTGWGQTGPLARAVGHDINYIALSGALHAVGPAGEKPVVPLNYVGDFGGGGMLLAVGMLAALLEAQRSGQGQVVDAAMIDGAALLSAMMYGFRANGWWTTTRGTNLLDGGAPFYTTYECADGKYIAVGAIEPKFYAALVDQLGMTSDADLEAQLDPARWRASTAKLEAIFRTRTREAWCRLLEGTDACVAPVLDWDEAPRHPHNLARGTFVEVEGVVQPAPAPRFSRTELAPTVPATATPADLATIVREWDTASPVR